MTAIKVGLVDLDTSHPGNWAPLIRELGYEIAGVYDGGTIRPAGYADAFARTHGIAKVYDSPEAMAEEVDIAIIHSCNWDLHVHRALPFVQNRKAVLFDKPMAGNVRDLRQMLSWEADGIRIAGGSSLRVCREAQQWRGAHGDPAEQIYAYVGCGVDEFNYGIHAYALLHGLFGPGIASVRHLGDRIQQQVEVAWRDGRRGVVGIGQTAGPIPFYATITTSRDVAHFQVDNQHLYRELLADALPYLAGLAPSSVALDDLVEVELAAIAAKISRERGGEAVRLQDVPPDYPGYDGAAFAVRYRAIVTGKG